MAHQVTDREEDKGCVGDNCASVLLSESAMAMEVGDRPGRIEGGDGGVMTAKGRDDVKSGG